MTSTRNGLLSGPFFCAAAAGAVVLALAASAAAQTTIRVPLDHPTIQAAINAAGNGDTVLVAPGTYLENISFLGKAITVTSEAGPETTIIDGNQADSVVKFISGEGRASVFSGFAVLNGRSTRSGGGIWIKFSSPTIAGNIIANNRACEGAGLAVDSGSPLIERNTIINNLQAGCSGGGGGGISVRPNPATGPHPKTEILNNVISGNGVDSADGGGIRVVRNTLIRGNLISGNFAS
ncbi:MAG TPA: right-handed parallel beta-helix repeat-containing protein, partial [Burkholderiales bacterium]|nr:right-handed parallel beta-helix repeat-containing protein [Burkholderiales bacterium]